MALLKFIIIFYAIYFIIKLIIKNFVNKITSNSIFGNYDEMNKQNFQKDNNTMPEGHITIQNSDKKNKRLDKSVGEYIDFEDVSDEKNSL